MDILKIGWAIFVLAWLVCAVPAETLDAGRQAPEYPLKLAVGLTDGSRIIGTPAVATIGIHAVFGRIEAPWAQVTSAELDQDNENIKIVMTNGDRISGVHALDTLRLKTIFGNVGIDASHIRRINVIDASAGILREGLALWNRLGSAIEVEHSIVGPGGVLNAGRFVEGDFGKGIELNMNEQFGVTFPLEVISGDSGCIEFRAKLLDFPQNLPWGNRPALVTAQSDSEQTVLMLHFNGNDGASNGGLCASLAGFGSAGTGRFGNWTYARALGPAGNIDDWNHYALVWHADGIPGVDNGKRKFAVFINGTLNTQIWNERGEARLNIPKQGRFGLLSHQGLSSGSIIYDNLKVWNHAKTDFDRNCPGE